MAKGRIPSQRHGGASAGAPRSAGARGRPGGAHPEPAPLAALLHPGGPGECAAETLLELLRQAGLPIEVWGDPAALAGLAGKLPAGCTAREIGAPGTTDKETGGPVERIGLAPGRPLVLIEPGAWTTADWAVRLVEHLERAAGAACAAAGTSLGLGSEIEPADAAPLRREAWSQAVARLIPQWSTLHEDAHEVSSPAILFADARRQARALGAWWRSGGAAPVRLAPDARLLVARDVAARRDPKLAPERRLAALAHDPMVPEPAIASSLAELATLQARLVSAVERGQHPLARLRLAELCNLTGQYQRAQEHARRALETWPAHIAARLALAEASAFSGQGTRARSLLQSIAQGGPVAPALRARLLASLGEVWRRGGDAHQAEECFDSALAIEPEEVLALNGRAAQAMETGDFGAAVGDLRVAAKVAPLRAETWSNLGRALAHSGEVEEAREVLGRALALHPAHREARQLLSRLSALGPRGLASLDQARIV